MKVSAQKNHMTQLWTFVQWTLKTTYNQRDLQFMFIAKLFTLLKKENLGVHKLVSKENVMHTHNEFYQAIK